MAFPYRLPAVRRSQPPGLLMPAALGTPRHRPSAGGAPGRRARPMRHRPRLRPGRTRKLPSASHRKLPMVKDEERQPEHLPDRPQRLKRPSQSGRRPASQPPLTRKPTKRRRLPPRGVSRSRSATWVISRMTMSGSRANFPPGPTSPMRSSTKTRATRTRAKRTPRATRRPRARLPRGRQPRVRPWIRARTRISVHPAAALTAARSPSRRPRKRRQPLPPRLRNSRPAKWMGRPWMSRPRMGRPRMPRPRRHSRMAGTLMTWPRTGRGRGRP